MLIQKTVKNLCIIMRVIINFKKKHLRIFFILLLILNNIEIDLFG